MTWNLRVVRQKLGDEWFYAIHEVYYDKKNRAWGVTSNPSSVRDDSLEGLQTYYRMMAEAFTAPVMDFDKIPEPGADSGMGKGS